MARRTTCHPCQMGDHKRHYRVVQHPPEGGFGGAVCDCKGECRDRDPHDRLADLGIDERILSALRLFKGVK